MVQNDESSDRLISYKYRTLSPNAHTRVIKLQPSLDVSTPLYCSLVEINLDDEGQSEYDALSYTWGIPSFTEELIFDHCHSKMITENLYHALRRFRLPVEIRTIWVDAICINQEDDEEKAKQIPFMKQIYRSASSVLVWLGADRSGAESLRRLHHHMKQSRPAATPAEITRELANVTKLPWFHRRWIIQEVVLNPNVILHCAKVSMPWTRFIQLLGNTDTGIGALASLVKMATLWKAWILGEGNEAELYMLSLLTEFHNSGCGDDRDMIYALGGLASDVEMQDDSHRTNSLTTSSQTREVNQIKGNDGTETRQNDYHGLSGAKKREGHEKAIIPVDYTVSAEWLYQKVAAGLVHSPGVKIVDLLMQCVVRHTGDESNDISSWAPDWRKPRVREPLWSYSDVRGWLDPQDESTLVIESSNIVMLGRVVDNLSILFPTVYDELEIAKWFSDTWERMSELQMASGNASGSNVEKDHLLARLVNTVLCENAPFECSQPGYPNPEYFRQSWNEYREYLSGICKDIQQNRGPLNPEFCKFVWNYMKGRTIFLWEDSANSHLHFGFGPPHTHTNDLIAFLGHRIFENYFNTGMRGLGRNKSSYLLRRSSRGRNLTSDGRNWMLSGRFRFMGDCQVMIYSGWVVHDLTGESEAPANKEFPQCRQITLS
ncbi:HET-domain-containing protein [Hypoxylon crocopeplum]|nr:HET-domain-containing protein [Hypoxylon crocopeplum]